MLHQHDTAIKYLLSSTCLLCIRESSIISTMLLVPAEAVTMCWAEDWHKGFVPNNIQTLAAVIWKSSFHIWSGANVLISLLLIFRQLKNKELFWIEKSHLPFCSTILVFITRTFGVFNPDNSKLQGHQPRLKCSMLLSGKDVVKRYAQWRMYS